MEQAKMDRISELTRLSRERALSAEEQTERAALRAEYLAEWKKSAAAALENTYIERPDGSREKLRKKKK